jgi:asparagine synthase (glutamine-hydrolysing)
MCGIVGIHGPGSHELIQHMNDSQIHRGPDSAGISNFPHFSFSFAMRRLAIIDLDGGIQPMFSTDRNYALVYNGELFNASNIRHRLISKGVQFSSHHSDTEVLLQVLIHEGIESIQQLNGMFSFAFFDIRKGLLFLCRDRYGIKPLYYLHTHGYFAFASEIKALANMPFYSPRVNNKSVVDFFSYQYILGPRTIYDKIYNLPPASLLTYDLAGSEFTITRWWRPLCHANYGTTLDELTEQLLYYLRTAVYQWSSSDVSLSASLSGGIDSAAIVALASQCGVKLNTYSLGFADQRFNRINELSLAKEIANRYGTSHTEVILEPNDIISNIPHIIHCLDQPYSGGLPSWFVYNVASYSHKVILTGVGGDELFGNYGKASKLLGRTWFKKDPFNLSKPHRLSSILDALPVLLYMSDSLKQDLFTFDIQEHYSTQKSYQDAFLQTQGADLRDKVMQLDFTSQLPDEFLYMTDRFSMAHSLEARTPFLDNNLVDFVLTIPPGLRAPRANPKKLLRHCLREILPSQILRSRKKGFILPLEIWLREELSSLIDTYLDESSLLKAGVLNPSFHQTVIEPHMSAKRDNSHLLFTALMFHMWYFNSFEGRL